MSTTITTTKSMNEDLQNQSTRYQQLKQRKEALEKKLNEKYEQLHQICQKVNLLMSNCVIPGNYSFVIFLFLGGYTDWQQLGSLITALQCNIITNNITQKARH